MSREMTARSFRVRGVVKKTKEQVLEEFRCGSIQDAAMSVIARKGIDATTIQDIADEAGIAKGTVYLYFRDREELFAKAADRAFEKLVLDLEPAFDADGPFPERLRGVVLQQLEFFDENRAYFRATMAHPKPESQKRKLSSYARYAARLEKLFADARESGELRAGLAPTAVADLYRDCIRGAIVRRLDRPTVKKSRTSMAADAELIASILLHGIQPGEK
jgi:AcrR family transcriptional regulator